MGIDGKGVQTIRAKNIDEARQILFDRYNMDYTIVDKQRVPKKGFFGFFQKDELLVSYTVKPRTTTFDSSYNPYGNPMNSILQQDNLEFEKNKSELLKKTTAKSSQGSVSSEKLDSQYSELSKKMEELTRQLKNIPSQSSAVHPTINQIQELLSQNDFSFNYIQEITEKIKKTFPLEQLDDFALVQRTVVDWIGESIKVGIPVSYKRPRVVIIVGPTGVGKTTTLVKLAAQFIKEARQKSRPADFCFITTDSMRVGAMEQLSRYGEIVDKQVLKAQTQADVQKIYEEYKDNYDAFFIDTGGYSPNDAKHIAQMKETLTVQGLNPEIYLAFTASTKTRDLLNIMQNYEPFGYQGVIVTKCDESTQYGNVISALYEKHKVLSYATHGQKITETLSKGNIIALLTRLEGFKIDRIHIEDKFFTEENSEEQ